MRYDELFKVRFDELGKIITGKTPSTKVNQYWDGKIQFITPKDIQINKYVNETDRYITEEGLNSINNILLGEGAVAVSCIGNIGYVGKIIHKAVTNQQLNTIIPNQYYDSDYVYYLMKNSWSLFKSLENQSTTVSIINKSQFSSLEVSVFKEKKKQKAIANILSSLDDKIELNNKINKNLEEIAQTLYKRWFVDFEFPNENGEPYKSSGGEMVDSELGMIPKGWKIEFLGSSRLTKLMKSGILRFDGSKKYIATADVSDTSITSFSTKITFDERPSRANMQPKINSVWFAKMKDSRKLIRVSENSSYLLSKCIFSTGFAGIETINSLNYIWTYLISTDFDETKNNLCNGTTMQAINNDNIKRIRILSPNIHVLKMYEDLVQPLFDLVESNSIQNDKLAKTRDELLPKLMSGEIEVPIEE